MSIAGRMRQGGRMAGWLGVDVGTSSTKAVVYSDAGAPLGVGRATTPWTAGPAGVELDPDALLAAALDAVAGALAAAPRDLAVGGVGIASMGETGVLVDGGGRPLVPAIAWHDTRDGAELDALRRDVGAEAFARLTGKPLWGQWSLTKHRWLLANRPAARAAVRRFDVAGWVARGLGADEASERTLACRTGWLDLSGGTWDDGLLAWSGAPASLLPPLVGAGEAIGRVGGPAAPDRLAGAVVTIAGHDHQAAAVGAGVDAAGEVLDSSGSSEALVRVVPAGLSGDQVEALAAEGITTDLAVRARCWSLLGGTEGGLALGRVLGLLGVGRAGLAGLDEAAREAGGAGGVRVGGIGTAAVSVTGVGDGTGPGHVWWAATRTATAAARRRLAAMDAIVGPHGRIVATGGWCASTAVMAAKRELLGPVVLADAAEAGTLGAATLAARAAGALGPDEVLGAPAAAAAGGE